MSRRLRAVTLASSVAGAVIVALDGTVLTVAQPRLQRELDASYAQVQWTSTGYLIAVASLLVFAGRLGDLPHGLLRGRRPLGHRRLFAVGMLGFGAASAGIGLAPSIGWVIALRVAQGVFGALAQPATLGMLRAAFPPDRLATPLAVRTSAIAVAAAAGPLAGGALAAGPGWRAAFFLNVGPALLFGLLALVPHGAERGHERGEPAARTAPAARAGRIRRIGRIGGARGAGWAGRSGWAGRRKRGAGAEYGERAGRPGHEARAERRAQAGRAEYRERAERGAGAWLSVAGLDLPGAVLLAVGLGCVVRALVAVAEPGGAGPGTAVVAAVAVVAGVAFVRHERRTAVPLLPPDVIGSAAVGSALVVLVAASAALSGTLFVATYVLQDTLGLDPFQSSLRSLPLALLMVLAAAGCPVLLRRFGARRTTVTAMLLLALGVLVLARATAAPALCTGFALLGAGFGTVMVAATQVVVREAAVASAGVAGGLQQTAMNVGPALGVAAATALRTAGGGAGPALAALAAVAGAGAAAAAWALPGRGGHRTSSERRRAEAECAADGDTGGEAVPATGPAPAQER
ncbi:MFS transporter [Streptomyces sennicomposti]|uniref:MFS transporter n=1 Tax=Streptomyces sennicomposti TaxID=2873384 RepID=UPI001CA67221|nr:MFS transporter [Streptomyces sennicomposti]MBY8866551.1 MFS transporter [Streptomyces sennicomposti]